MKLLRASVVMGAVLVVPLLLWSWLSHAAIQGQTWGWVAICRIILTGIEARRKR